MCGICGIADSSGRTDTRVLVEQMQRSLLHRGPDEQNTWSANDVAFGHTRLSIIDLAGGQQPLANEDGSIVVTYNGEIFNHQELREGLLARGHRFRTRCDTEVIVHLYEEDGPECVQHLDGQFAFALYDRRDGTVMLARDRVGIKPLYYHAANEKLVFASELKALLSDPNLPTQINPDALHFYFTYFYIPSPLTIYENSHKLPPAHYLVWKRGQYGITRYWSLPRQRAGEQQIPSADDVDRELGAATRRQLQSDVPLGCFLSGGVDSSTIAWHAQHASAEPLRTFTVRFPGKSNDESAFGAAIAGHLGTRHETLDVTPHDSLDDVPRLLAHFDEPFADSSLIPTHFLCKAAKERVTVCLSGDGGDELYGGYRRYRDLLRSLGRPPLPSLLENGARGLNSAFYDRRFAKRIMARAGTPWERYFRRVSCVDRHDREQLFGPDFSIAREHAVEQHIARHFEGVSAERLPDQMMRADFETYLPEYVLTKVDRMSLLHALEVRVPFLDHKVVEQAFRLPLDQRVSRLNSKILLRKLMAPRLPAGILDRPKSGFGVSLKDWFQSGFRDYAIDVISNRRAVREGYLNRRFIDNLCNGRSRAGRNRSLLWALMVFETWTESNASRKAGRPRSEARSSVA
jgi:asparagine synthase (glutamine-hydrolysing)